MQYRGRSLLPFLLLLLFIVVVPCTLPSQANWTRRTFTTAPPDRIEHVMAYDLLRARTVLFGGRGGGYLGDTWEWDGTRWLQRSPATSPAARSNHAMCHDLSRGRVVMFGGTNGRNALGDTWEWSGTNWALRTTGVQPSPRVIHAMAFNRANGRTLLFGGNSRGALQNDTWEWDGTTWTKASPITNPPARWGHHMAYDPIRQKILMFSGRGNSGLLDDLWEWDGSDWSQLSPTVRPSARADHIMVWDAMRERMVVFGGSNHPGSPTWLDDTWEWDGTTWEKRSPATMPSARCCHAAVYDLVRNETVMMGGHPGGVPETFFYQTSSPAVLSTSGTGCAGAGGVPTLTANRLPWVGDTFQVDVGSIGTGARAVLFVGLSNTVWTGGTLPFNLGVMGYPSCNLRVSTELLFGGVSSLSIPIPNMPSLAGLSLYFQAASLGPGNQLGVSTAVRALLGAR